MYLLPLWWLGCTIYLSIRSRKLHIIYKDFNSQCFLRTLVLSTQLLTQGPKIQQNWKSAGRNALIMKIFNNWHRALIFLLMTEVTRAQRQGSTLCRRNLSCPFQGLIPSTSHWKWLMFKGTGAQTSRIWCCLPELPCYFLCTHSHTHSAYRSHGAASQWFVASLSCS